MDSGARSGASTQRRLGLPLAYLRCPPPTARRWLQAIALLEEKADKQQAERAGAEAAEAKRNAARRTQFSNAPPEVDSAHTPAPAPAPAPAAAAAPATAEGAAAVAVHAPEGNGEATAPAPAAAIVASSGVEGDAGGTDESDMSGEEAEGSDEGERLPEKPEDVTDWAAAADAPKLVVSGLAPATSAAALQQYLSDFVQRASGASGGGVLDTNVLRNKSGDPTGRAFVALVDAPTARLVLEAEHEIDGKRLTVKEATGKLAVQARAAIHRRATLAPRFSSQVDVEAAAARVAGRVEAAGADVRNLEADIARLKREIEQQGGALP